MKIFALFTLFCAVFLPVLRAAEAPKTAEICIVMGTPGDSAYAPGFSQAVKNWQEAAQKAGANITVIGVDPLGEKDPSDHDRLRDWIAKLDPDAATPVWLIYLGHGTFDSREARLNLRNDDVTSTELAAWLKPLRRPLVFVHGGAASAPWVPALSGPKRIIVTATQSGREIDYARLGEKISQDVASSDADIDQDGQTSLLEALVTANQQVQDFYTDNDRMATEHAMLDDNGDKRGTPAEWFRGTRLVRRPNNNAVPDGNYARLFALVETDAERSLTPEQLQMRASYEQQLEQLKARKGTMADADYYAELEKIVRQLAALYAPKTGGRPAQTPPASAAKE